MLQNYLALLLQSSFHSSFFRKETKIIFFSTGQQPDKLLRLAYYFRALRILNVVILFYESSWKIFRLNQITLTHSIRELSDTSADSDLLFPDQLINMEGYTYRIIIFAQIPRLWFKKGKIIGIDVAIFEEIAKHQNAKVEFSLIEPIEEQFGEALNNQKFDLTLNTAVTIGDKASYRRIINTHDVNGFCALIPIPPRMSFLQFLFTPFDAWSWILIALVMIVCAVLWRLLGRDRNSNSESYFVFGVIAYFVGQSIPFKENRRMQVILLQLCIMMAFIMGNAYQSLLISSMATSREGIRYKTISEMINSGLKFKVDKLFFYAAMESTKYQSVIDNMEIAGRVFNYEALAKKKYAVIARCDILKIQMAVSGELMTADHFYMLPEILMPFYDSFFLANSSPFYDRLQLYFEKIFESGIRQYWREFFEIKGNASHIREEEYVRNEKYLLTMDDLYGAFYILLVGIAFNLVIFIFEIFFSDFLKHLSYKKSIKRVMRRMTRLKRTKRVKIIQVRPFNERNQGF